MQNISRLPASVGSHRAGLFAMILACGLLLFSACNDAHETTADQLNTSTARNITGVSLLLRTEGQLQLQTFQQWVGLMKQYNGQASTYGQELLSDRQALYSAQTSTRYLGALETIRQHTADIQLPALKNEADHQEQQLAQEVSAWSNTHTYHDGYNDTTYHMGYEYGSDGLVGWIQDELSSARTIADYQQAIEDANNSLTNFQAYQSNASDSTPWQSPHQTDRRLMQLYHVLNQKVVVVSLSEEALRIYNAGNLVKAFQVTTGRPEKPSLPGAWVIESKQSPTVFKSDEPPGSPYWYPDTPINYAMLYHSGGYFLHDSWWRADYGPDTQFPHYDSSGDSFSFDGSHGCVNLAPDNAAWIYHYVDLNTPVLIY